MKLFVVFVVIVMTLVEIYCADDIPVSVEDNKDTEGSALQINDAEGTPATAKAKRGIFNYGYGGAVQGLTYNIPLGTAAYPLYGFQKPWHTSPYSKVYSTNFLAPHHHAHQHPVVHPVASPSYFLTPGSASVSSYNVNYPKYPFYTKPHIDIPLSYPRPTPSIFVQKPAIVPVAIPAFSNRIPIGRPAVLPAPHYHFVQAGSAASPAIYPVSSLQPQFIPIPLPVQPPTIHTFPTTLSTVPSFTTTTLASGTDGVTTLPGSHFITSGSSDSWRPIIVSHQHPTASTPTLTVQRPAISLLPPYGSAPAGAGAAGDQQTHQQQIELQQTFEEYGAPQEQQQFSQAQQQQVSHLYLGPGDNSLESNAAHLQLNNQEFAQGNILVTNDINFKTLCIL